MKISVLRTGGFAGLTETLGSADTAALAPELAIEAEQLVNEVRFFDLPADLPGGEIGADLFRYEVTVVDGDRRHTVRFTDDERVQRTPLKRLIEFAMRAG